VRAGTEMSGNTKPSDALLQRRPNVSEEILELPVVQLTLLQGTLSSGTSYRNISVPSTHTETTENR